MDPLGQTRRALERQLSVLGHVIQYVGGSGWVPLHQRTRELDIDCESHELLLWPVMELALEAPAIRMVGEGAALARGPKVLDLQAESLERLL